MHDKDKWQGWGEAKGNPAELGNILAKTERKKIPVSLKWKNRKHEKQKSEAMPEERGYKQIDKDTGPLRNLARGLLLDL